MRDYAAFIDALAQDLQIDPEIPLTGDLGKVEAAKLWLRKSALKKREDWPAEDLKRQADAAQKLFLEQNSRIASWTWQPTHPFDDLVLGEMKNLLHKIIVPAEPDDGLCFRYLAEHIAVGPGAAVGADAASFYTKLFASPLTSTSEDLVRLYRSAICEAPHWAEAEMSRNNRFGVQVVQGSNFFTVPKNSEIQRSCATEPSCNMLFQKAIGSYLERRLKACLGISLDTQPDLNRLLARQGSIDGSFGTIDLKSASDSISVALCDTLLPPVFVWWLKHTRSPYTTLPSGEVVPLNMISSMGNGFTFPLQTVIFAALVTSVYRVMGLPTFCNRRTLHGRTNPGNWAVFGDDIIVRREAYEYVCHFLQLLGFQVNVEKSFNTGAFRESCGSDWYAGDNIRGVYVRSLKTVPEVYSTINRLVRWSAEHGVALTQTLNLLLSWVRFLPVPAVAADHEGVKVHYDPAFEAQARKGRGERRQVQEARRYHGKLYRGIQVAPSAQPVPASEDESIRLGYSHYTEDGWAVALLGGYARTPPYEIDKGGYSPPVDAPEEASVVLSDGLSLREPQATSLRVPTYVPPMVIGVRPPQGAPLKWKRRLMWTSQWDYTSPPPSGLSPVGGERWKTLTTSIGKLMLAP